MRRISSTASGIAAYANEALHPGQAKDSRFRNVTIWNTWGAIRGVQCVGRNTWGAIRGAQYVGCNIRAGTPGAEDWDTKPGPSQSPRATRFAAPVRARAVCLKKYSPKNKTAGAARRSK